MITSVELNYFSTKHVDGNLKFLYFI